MNYRGYKEDHWWFSFVEPRAGIFMLNNERVTSFAHSTHIDKHVGMTYDDKIWIYPLV